MDEKVGLPALEIIAEPRQNSLRAEHVLGALCALLPYALLFHLFLGPLAGVGFIVILGLPISLILFAVRFMLSRSDPPRAIFTPIGMTLASRGRGFFRTRPVQFEWQEVKYAKWRRTLSPDIKSPLNVSLDRSVPFLSLVRSPIKSVLVPGDLASHPDFLQTLRANLPAEKIRGKPGCLIAYPIKTFYRRLWAIFLAIVTALAIANAALMMSGILNEWLLILFLLSAFVSAGVGLIMFSPVTGSDLALATTLLAGAFTFHRAITVALLGKPAAALGFMGFIAALFAGASAVAFFWRRSPGWAVVGLCYLAAIAAFLAGEFFYGGIPDKVIGFGNLPWNVDPWTPQSDGFLIRESEHSYRWYSDDGTPGRLVTPPSTGFGYLLVVGENGAMFLRRIATGDEVWHLPRAEGEPIKLMDVAKAPYVTVSPDGATAAFCGRNTQGNAIAYLVDLSRPQVSQFTLPDSINHPVAVSERKDGWLLVLDGVQLGEKNSSNRTAGRAQERTRPGMLFKIWRWRPGQSVPPDLIYCDTLPWARWRADRTFDHITAARDVETNNRRHIPKFIDIRLSSGKPIVRALAPTGPRYRMGRTTLVLEVDPVAEDLPERSSDGRFTFIRRPTWAFFDQRDLPLFEVRDNRSGETRRLCHGTFNTWCESAYPSPPPAHKLLVTGFRLQWPGEGWEVWPEKAEDFVKPIIRLVDLDKGWR